MKYLDVNSWERKEHFYFYKQFADPYFGVTTSVDVTRAYAMAKKHAVPFFVLYLHACMKAINVIENFKYRIQDDKVVVYNQIDASATILRPDYTFGFSYIYFDKDLRVFNQNFQKEKDRILRSTNLFPPVNLENCVYCSALPWLHFSGHKELKLNFENDSIPRLAFGKYVQKNERLEMPVSVIVNHALMDGYHIGLFFEIYQKELNSSIINL